MAARIGRKGKEFDLRVAICGHRAPDGAANGLPLLSGETSARPVAWNGRWARAPTGRHSKTGPAVTPEMLATVVLAVHLGVVVFNIFGMVAVPLGAWRSWRFVRGFWWRLVHLASLFVVALQALLGRACFLTIWQSAIEAQQTSTAPPMIATWINRVLYWPLPLWVFAVGYVVVFIYVLLLWRWVPPRRRGAA
jgi:hypothetical protein